MSGKLTLYIAAPSVKAMAALYKKLTGKDMTPEALAKLREALAAPPTPS